MTTHYLGRGNRKYKISGMRTGTFGIPAFEAADGTRTCPGAGACLQGCYAKQGHYVCPNVRAKNQERFELTQKPFEFVDLVSREINRLRLNLVRIHDTGDFYTRSYLDLWIEICRRCPETRFLAYTKMVPMFRGVRLPSNLTVVFSEGGRWDHEIDQARDKFARVFPDLKSLRQAGFTDCHKTDLPALRPEVRRIGLVYHGWPSRRFQTS